MNKKRKKEKQKDNGASVLEILFTSKSRVRILGYLFFKNSGASLREISRKEEIQVSSVQRETKKLMNIGLLKKQDEKFELNRKCRFLEDLKKIFIKTDYLYKPIKDSFQTEKIKFVLIFGSFTKGNFSTESDVDVLVIGDISQNEAFDKIKKAERKINREINLVVWSLEDLKKKKDTGFVKEIKKDYILVKGDENEFQKIVG